MAHDVIISPIKEMEIRSAKIPGVISLAQGVPSFDTPECIKRKVIEALEEGRVARYSLSPGMLELREAIEYRLSKQHIFYDFEHEIIVTAGSIEAITATFLALLEPGDEVLIPDPTYTSYQAAIKTARAVPVFVPLDESSGWGFDIEAFRSRITAKTKAILFCNPNNPTGTVFNREQLMQLAELSEIYNLYILSDEVYRDFIFHDDPYYSIAQFSAFRKRIIYIFSFSKAYAMTGWRVAFLAADYELAERILGVHDALVTCAPVISQWGALAALELADQDIEMFRDEFAKRRSLICSRLDRLSAWFHYNVPTAAYFAFPGFTPRFEMAIKHRLGWDGDRMCKHIENMYMIKEYQQHSLSWLVALELLYQAKVAVVPGVAFGPAGENHIRLCFGRDAAEIREGMQRIARYAQSLQRHNPNSKQT